MSRRSPPGGSKSPSPSSAVYVDGSRSAEPPISAGRRGAMAFITLPEATRVAMPLASAGKTGMSASQPAGSSPRDAALQLRARARERAARTPRMRRSTPLRRVRRARAPRENARAPRRERGTRGSVGQPRFCLVRRTSSAPSGEPCASKVSCLFGEP